MINYQLTLFADLFSAAILGLLLLSIITSKQYKYNSTKALIVTMACTFAAILSDAFNYYCEGNPALDTVHMWAMAFTLLAVNVIEGFVGWYINCYVNEHKKPGVVFTYRFSIITAIVESCCFILTFVLGVMGKVFVLVDGCQTPGELYLIPFVLDALASLFMIGYVLSHTKYISRRDALTILTVVVFTASGYLLDGMLPGYNFSVMFGMVAILLNYLLVKDREVMDLRDEEDKRFRKRVQSVLALSDDFEIIFLVNLDNGKYKVARNLGDADTLTKQDFAGLDHFIEKNEQYINEEVHPDDRKLVLDALNKDLLSAQFEKAPNYIISYRLIKEGKEVWYKMKIQPERSWPSRHKVLIGIFNNDLAYRRERQHELELEKQLSRYTLVHKMIGSGSWSAFFGPDKVITKNVYSDEILNNLGYSQADADKLTFAAIVHPDDLQDLRDALSAILTDTTGKTGLEVDHRMQHHDGSWHWYHTSGRLLLNEDGSGEMLGTNINIDAEHEKKDLEIMREQNYVFMQFRTDVFNFIATQDSDPERFFYYFADKLMPNAGCDEIIYRRADGYTMKRSRPGAIIPTEQACENCRLMGYISKNCQLKADYCIEDKSKCPEEMIMPLQCPVKSIIGRVIYSEGVPKGFLALHFIEGRKKFLEAEKAAMLEVANLLNMGFERIKLREKQQHDFERYRLVHEIVHSGMWSYQFNKNGEIYKSEFSDELLAIIGWDREHFAKTSSTFQELIHPEDMEEAVDAFNAAIMDESGKVHFDSQYRMRNQEGEYHWFRSAGRVIRYPNGYGEFFGTHINIDAEKKREELQKAIERARDNAEAASAAKSTFLFNMSHDIRTPLNAIIGFTDMAITHKDETDKIGDYLNKVKSSSDFLLTIVNDVLDMSRIEAGKTKIEEKVCSVIDEAKRVGDLQIIAAEDKNITFIPSMENIDCPYVLADSPHIKQIIVNILNNAMKYTPEGGTIWYTIRQEKTDIPDEVIVRTTVKDNGIGMDPKFVTHIYEAFEREQNTTQSGIQGTGLGMSIVKRLTDLMGGTIDIDTAPGEGTTISISFRHKVATTEQIADYIAELKRTEESAMKIDEEKLVGKKLLLVEDNELNREISEQILQERGLVIETAVDGQEAVDLIKEKGVSYYDFVLMDIQMPVMDGYTATREIRKLPGAEKLPIAAFSANAFEEDKKLSLDAGMNIHVAKPINIKELTRSLASLL